MRKQFIKSFMVAAVAFLVLFGFRLMYGYVTHPDGVEQVSRSSWQSYGSEFEYGKRNYASKTLKLSQAQRSQAASVDQKYEKVGSLRCKSTEFDKDEATLRQLITGHKSLVQFEQKFGLKGQRTLKLAIGVLPEDFDSFIDKIKGIGKLVFIQIDKLDKTNEYLALQAQRTTLEKVRTSLISLKDKNGKISELVALENRILEIEEQIQATGVKLGEFDKENEFCTVKVTLAESQEKSRDISFLHRVKVALEWTVPVYLGIAIALFFATVTVFIILLGLPKLKPLVERASPEKGSDR